MATNAELQDRATRAEKRLETAAVERMEILAGHNAAKLLRERLTAERMRALAPALDAIAVVPSALQRAAVQLTETRVAVLGAGIVAPARDQRAALTAALAPLGLLKGVRAAVLALAANDAQQAALELALAPLGEVAALAGDVLALAIVEPAIDQPAQLQQLMAPLDLVDEALEQSATAVTDADNGWRRIPEEDRLALVAAET